MSDADFQRRLRETFQNEAIEHLRAISAAFFELEKTTSHNDQVLLIEQIFRAAHTLKGAARLVRERAAETLCHALETALAGVKQGNEPLSPAVVERLQVLVAQLARELNFGPVPNAPMPDDDGGLGEAGHDAGNAGYSVQPGTIQLGSYVRVPEGRLGSLMSQAEELLAAKHTGNRRVEMLRTLGARTDEWNKQWSRLRPHLAALRRLADQGKTQNDVSAVLQFVDWSQDYMSGLRAEVTSVTRSEINEQRWVSGMIDGMLDETKEILMLPASTLLEGFPSFVRETARLQQKEIALTITGAETEIDRRILEEVKDAVVHLVRNAIDHGIELPAHRRAMGKPPQGVISISVTQRHGSNVELVVTDDGAGVDLVAVREHATRLGIIGSRAEDMSEADLIALIFHSGLSTRPAGSDLSGHGLGLAIVRERAERLGGHVVAETKEGHGTSFRLSLPVTMARFRGVFVTAGQQEFALPSAYVRRVLRVPLDEIQKVKDDDTIVFQEKRLRLLSLASVLGVAAAERPAASRHVFVVIIAFGSSSAAFTVDDVLFEQEVMMKSLGKLLVRIGKIAGATISPTGRLVPVLNAGDLLAFSGRRLASPPARKTVARVVQRPRRLLVVEDSITARMLLKNILIGAGYEVRTAVDGVDAMTALKFEPMDAVVADIQMPRMDGFELTKRIRADKSLSTLPVVLVTSLASREDRERGVDAGANAYVIKSSFDQSDLLQIIERLLA